MKEFELKDFGKKFPKDFFRVPQIIYKDDNNWVCLPDSEIRSIFDVNKNKLLKDGDFNIWVLYEDKMPVARLIAFWTDKKSKVKHPHAGGIAFFECVDSQDAANMIFDVASKWLELEGMQAIDAVIVPGENFNHWGILIEGYMKQGFGMPYNMPYYKKLFETYGFKTYFEQLSYHVDLKQEFPERLVRFAQHVIDSGEFTFDHIRKSNLDKYVKDITTIFKDVWSEFHADFQESDSDFLDSAVAQLKPIIKEKFIWIAYKDNYPVGMEIALPDLNEIIDDFNGKMNVFNQIKLLKRLKTVKRARLLVFGINQDYHKSGLLSALFIKMSEGMKSEGVEELEMSWIGDYNPKANRLYKHLGNSKHTKTHATMRYIIDPNIIFERFTN